VQRHRRPRQRDEQACGGGGAFALRQSVGAQQGAAQRPFRVAEAADLVEVTGAAEQLRDLVVRYLDALTSARLRSLWPA
jgi:hypothetical protein